MVNFHPIYKLSFVQSKPKLKRILSMYHLLCKLGIEYDDIGCNYKIISVGCIEKSQFLFHLTFYFKVGVNV